MKYKFLVLFVLLISILISGCIDKQEYKGTNPDVKICYDDVNARTNSNQIGYLSLFRFCDTIETTESYNFILKEMKQKDLSQGSVSGSFLLIDGSIYGHIEDKMYLVVTFYDTRINSYKVTKLDLEQIEINTIGKNDSAYFKYKSSPDYNKFSIESRFGTFIHVLYLPDGWNII